MLFSGRSNRVHNGGFVGLYKRGVCIEEGCVQVMDVYRRETGAGERRVQERDVLPAHKMNRLHNLCTVMVILEVHRDE
jgi:hypothetical protein